MATSDSWRRAVLVELFTSQGCSSCPAADAFVADFPRLGWTRDRVVALTFHVDYWDDLGWKDPFASPQFTGRQRDYANRGALRAIDGSVGGAQIYTPQMVVDGSVHFSGRRRDVAQAEVQRAARMLAVFTIDGTAVASQSDQVQLRLRVAPVHQNSPMTKGHDWQIWAALSAKRARTAVGRGENRGETLNEAAIVRAVSDPVAVTADPTTIALRKPKDLPWENVEIAAVVQTRTHGQVGAVVALDFTGGAR